MLQGEQNQPGITLEVESFHDVMFVEFHSLFAQVEHPRDFLHGPAFSKQLNDFPLSWGQFLCKLSRTSSCGNPIISLQLRSQIGFSVQYSLYRLQQFRSSGTLEHE